MYRSRLGLAAAALLLALPASAMQGVAYQGVAHAAEGDGVLYEEHHLLRTEASAPVERIVLYRCPSGEAFARKRVSYGEPPYAPQFRMEDARFDYVEGFERGQRSGEAFVQRSDDDPLKKEAIALGESLVVDAGFDEFVRAHWDELQQGDAVALRFLVPSRLAAYGFKLGKTGEQSLYGQPASVYRLELSGLLGWFADAIDVSYRNSDRRLMRFVGLSNIRATPEENLIARIDFPPERSAGLDADSWQQALDEPLQSCQVGH